MVGFLFGEGQRERSAAELWQQRQRLEQMASQSTAQTPRNVGEGIASIGQALFARLGGNRLAPFENDERARIAQMLSGLQGGGMPMGGMGGFPMGGMPPGMPAAPPVAPAGGDMGFPAPPPVDAATLPPAGPMTGPGPGMAPDAVPMRPQDAPLPPQIGAAVDRVNPLAAVGPVDAAEAAGGMRQAASGPEQAMVQELAGRVMDPRSHVSPEFARRIPGIFAGESGGDYNALFGFSNREGGPFSNVRLTDMTVDQALDFANPRGQYGQWVANRNNGTVATPMGAYQVVGSTLRAAKNGLGLTGNEPMTPELQDRIGQWIYENQGIGAWVGYRPGVTEMPSGAGGRYAGGGGSQASGGPMGGGGMGGMGGGVDMGIVMQLAEIAGNPYANEGQRMIAQALIGQQIGGMDPMRQLQMQRMQMEMDMMGRPEPGARLVTGAEAEAMGLPPGAYNVMPDGRVTAIGTPQTNINMPGAPEIGAIPQGYEAIIDPETGQRVMREIPGGPVETERRESAEQSRAQAQGMLDTIDGLLNDPAFDQSVGWRAWQQRIPGTDQMRVGTRFDQIEGQAFLQAFESLKGGGQITEIEGQKATQAIGRLNRQMSAADARQALGELREILEAAAGRELGWLDSPAGQAAQQSQAQAAETRPAPPISPEEIIPPASFGVDPAVMAMAAEMGLTVEQLWQFMTPEDRALWAN